MNVNELNRRVGNRESFILANDGQFLGKLCLNIYDPESILNIYGLYGNPYSATSINNKYSLYGSQYSSLSPYNPYMEKTEHAVTGARMNQCALFEYFCSFNGD